MFCSQCGAKMEDGAKFCSECGAKAEDLPTEAAQEQAAAPDATTRIDPMDGIREEGLPIPPAERMANRSDETVILPTAEKAPDEDEPEAPYEPPVDMTHAFDPHEGYTPAAPAATSQMPVVGATPVRSYDAAPPEEMAGKHKKKSRVGMVIGIVVGVLVLAGIIAALLFTFVFSKPTMVTISYETSGGSTIAATEVEAGKTVNSPADPTKEGYAFGGWFADANCSTPVSFPLSVTEDATIYAKWTALSGPTGTTTGNTATDDNKYASDEESAAALKGYLSSVKKASAKVAALADDFNKNYLKGKSQVTKLLSETNDVKADVQDLLTVMDSEWKVSTMTITKTYDEERQMLEQASQDINTRINSIDYALQAVQNLGSSATTSEKKAVALDYLQSGHDANNHYEKLIKKLDKNLK